MKTHTATKQIELPLLKIVYDEYSETPRVWDNLGYFVQKENKHISPDGRDNDFYMVMVESGETATSTHDHIKLMKKGLKKLGHKVRAIYPVSMYEHGGVSYTLGQRFGFDSSNNAFYIVLDNTETKQMSDENIEAVIKGELENYTAWANGNVYEWSLLNEETGEYDEWQGGYYDLDHIKEELGSDWANEDLNDYLIND